LFRKSNGEVSLDFLPARTKTIIKQLEEENKAIRNEAIKADKTGNLKKRYKAYKNARKKVYKKYFVSKKTEDWLAKYSDASVVLGFQIAKEYLPRWATKLVVRDIEDEDGQNLIDKYTELVPGDGWVTTADREDLINKEFERLSSMEGNENETVIPKENLYKNEQFSKIKNSDSLKALYDAAVSVIGDSNEEFYNNSRASKYRLPQISGSMYNYIQSTGAAGAWKYMKE